MRVGRCRRATQAAQGCHVWHPGSMQAASAITPNDTPPITSHCADATVVDVPLSLARCRYGLLACGSASRTCHRRNDHVRARSSPRRRRVAAEEGLLGAQSGDLVSDAGGALGMALSRRRQRENRLGSGPAPRTSPCDEDRCRTLNGRSDQITVRVGPLAERASMTA